MYKDFRTVFFIAAALCAALTMSRADRAHSAAEGYQVVEVKGGGAIKGKVLFKGEMPKPIEMSIGKDTDVCVRAVDKKTGKRVINVIEKDDRDGLKNAVVFIEKISKGKAWTKEQEEPVINQKNCVFFPSVKVIPVHVKTKIVNSDPILHNIHTYELMGKDKKGKRTLFNLGQPPNMEPISKTINKKGKGFAEMKIECDAHNFMHESVLLAEHPYYSATGERGEFSIGNVPPGKYKLVAWHPVAGEVDAEVEVKAGADTVANFELSVKK